MRDLASWGLVLCLSTVLHVVAALGFSALLVTQNVPQKPGAEAKVRMAALTVPRTDASQAEPEIEGIPDTKATGQSLPGGAVPKSLAQPVAPSDVPAHPLPPASDPAVPQSTAGTTARSDSGDVAPAAPLEISPASITATEHSKVESPATATPNPSSNPIAATPMPEISASIEIDARFENLEVGMLPSQAIASTNGATETVAEVSNARLMTTAATVEGPFSRIPANKPDRVLIAAATASQVQTPTLQALPRDPANQVAAVGASLSSESPENRPSLSLPPDSDVAGPAPLGGQRVATSRPASPAAGSLKPDGQQAPALRPRPDAAVAVLAWSGDLSLQVGQQTISAAAALGVAPTSAQDGGLRDAISDRLSTVECARAQTVYDPASGAIDLRGHVRTDADRDALVAAVSAELGGALPIVDRLRRLDAPQCEVLVRLSDMPLPQSVEQLINPLIIGDDLHTRVYRFESDQSVRFDLAGADYDGWIYLDYFDNEGQVLHLMPNEYIDPFILSARRPIVFGGGGEDDLALGKFELRVSPPFGQDIAVAMVSNRKLFETNRPTVELAENYLAELATRITHLRNTDQDFKGEWVYLFVETFANN